MRCPSGAALGAAARCSFWDGLVLAEDPVLIAESRQFETLLLIRPTAGGSGGLDQIAGRWSEFDDAGRLRRVAFTVGDSLFAGQSLAWGARSHLMADAVELAYPFVGQTVPWAHVRSASRNANDRQVGELGWAGMSEDVLDLVKQVERAETPRGALEAPTPTSVTTFGRTRIGTLTEQRTNGGLAFSAGMDDDERTIADVGGVPLQWSRFGDVTKGPTAANQVASLEWSDDGRLAPTEMASTSTREARIYDALGRAVGIGTERDGAVEYVWRVFRGANLVSESFSNGWTRQWVPGFGLDQPLVYRITCPAGTCATPPMGLDVSATELPDTPSGQPGAETFFVLGLHGLDVLTTVSGDGGVLEVWQSSTYGTRQRINLKFGLVECDDGIDLGCASQVGSPLGHQGGFRSPVSGLYDFRARMYSTGMRVWLSRDPLGTVDAANRPDRRRPAPRRHRQQAMATRSPASRLNPAPQGASGGLDPDSRPAATRVRWLFGETRCVAPSMTRRRGLPANRLPELGRAL